MKAYHSRISATSSIRSFYKRNAEDNSNGLGLAITQSIIHLHRGQISVTSNDRDGTTFTVTLPETN